MNLADAIRKAASSPPPVTPVPYEAPDFASKPEPRPIEPVETEPKATFVAESVETPQWVAPVEERPSSHTVEPVATEPESADSTEDRTVVTNVEPLSDGGSLVHLELRLTPEQTYALFKTVLGTNHKYMTLREASSYLRIKQRELEDLAAKNDIPAFQVDGHWRFEIHAIDEWAKAQTTSPDQQEQSA